MFSLLCDNVTKRREEFFIVRYTDVIIHSTNQDDIYFIKCIVIVVFNLFQTLFKGVSTTLAFVVLALPVILSIKEAIM
jgi:hypothetical protein